MNEWLNEWMNDWMNEWMTHRMFLHLPLEGSLGDNYTEHQLQCMLHRLIASSETHSPEYDKPSVLAARYRFHNAFIKN